MSKLTIRCMWAAIIFLIIGMSLGVWFALSRVNGAIYRPLHAELNIWGWVTLLIYGMAYHMLPRFTGRTLASPRMAEFQSWLAIAGVAGATVGWWGWLNTGNQSFRWILAISGIVQTLAALIFAWLMLGLLRLEVRG